MTSNVFIRSILRSVLLLVSLLILRIGVSQNISGKVSDIFTGRPIGYVNIGVVDTDSGTVSNQDGTFYISIDNAKSGDVLRFSFVGYASYDLPIHSIENRDSSLAINMKQLATKLDEVIITSTRPRKSVMGVPKKKCYPIPFYKKVTSNIPFPQGGYRHEIGSFFANNDLLKIDSIQINFSGFMIDTLDLRINLYEYRDDEFVQLLNSPIYLQKAGLDISESQIINLSYLDVFVKSDFLITIENFKEVEDDAYRILANFRSIGKKYPTYYRSNSHGKWAILKSKSKNFGLSILAFVN